MTWRAQSPIADIYIQPHFPTPANLMSTDTYLIIISVPGGGGRQYVEY